MTTESQDRRSNGAGVLLGAASATLALGAVLTVVGQVVSGRPAAVGAAVGISLVLTVLGLSTVVVDVTARVLPAAALLVALLTYTLQVVLMAAVLVGLTRSGLLERSVDPTWLGTTVIAGTLGWTLAQLVRTVRVRVPAFDTTTSPAEPVAAGAVERAQGGER